MVKFVTQLMKNEIDNCAIKRIAAARSVYCNNEKGRDIWDLYSIQSDCFAAAAECGIQNAMPVISTRRRVCVIIALKGLKKQAEINAFTENFIMILHMRRFIIKLCTERSF